MKQTITNQYRQGDVLLNPAKIPADAKRKEVGALVVLAYGEATGHKHAIHDIESVAILETPDGRRFLDVKESVDLKHDEHPAIAVERGSYEITIQREYEPSGWHNVAD